MNNNLIESCVGYIVETLIEARKDQKITYTDLGKKIGLSRSTIHLIENRKRNPNIVTLLLICDGLGLNLENILIDFKRNHP